MTVVVLKRGPTRFRAYLHTPDYRRVGVVSIGGSADAAADRAEALFAKAVGDGVAAISPGGPLRLSDETPAA